MGGESSVLCFLCWGDFVPWIFLDISYSLLSLRISWPHILQVSTFVELGCMFLDAGLLLFFQVGDVWVM
jgi:hypothetical protein